MNTQVMPFQYHEKPVRVVMQDATPWWVAKDVCDVLDIKWSGDKVTLSKIKESWKMSLEIQDSQGRFQPAICINEPAVYKFAFRSNKPEAEAFTDWVAEEVLPQVMHTGRYETTGQPAQAKYVAVLEETARLQAELLRLKNAEIDRLNTAPKPRKRITPEEEQQILTMKSDGHSTREIAEALERNIETIRTVLYRHKQQ